MNTFDHLISGNNYIRLEVYHSDGGYNYFDGSNRPRGVVVNVRRIEKSEGCVSFMLMGNDSRQFHVRTLKRRSKKVLQEITDFVSRHQTELAEAGLTMDWPRIRDILTPATTG